MKFPTPLVAARLLRRYKRFLFDAELPGGEFITGSCPNTGSMRGLTSPGSEIWLSLHNSPSRKYRHMLELVHADGTLVGINTAMPNRIAEEAILAGLIPSLSPLASLKREQRYGTNSRIDFLLSAPDEADAYIEVKNVHFTRSRGLAEFPDSVTERGTKHLNELISVVAAGHRGIMLYVIQRNDCERLRICDDLDPKYGVAFRQARQNGVEAYAVSCSVSPQGIFADRLIPIDESGQRD